MNIVVLDGYSVNPGDNPWDPVARFGTLTVYERTPAWQLPERAMPADIILTNKALLNAAVLETLPRLRLICELATGYDNIDTAAAGRLGIPVANVPDYSTESVVQHTVGLLLELFRGTGEHNSAVHQGAWSRSPDFCFWTRPLIELSSLKLGIIGFGRIGCRVAEVARALGMQILAYSPRPKQAPGHLPISWLALEELFSAADVVSLHCPLTADNRQFVNRRLLSTMKPTAFLINTARGGLVHDADLAHALNSHTIAGAALDVVSQEPIALDSPLLSARNCLITPHIAWASRAARQRLVLETGRNIEAFLQGVMRNVVNAQHLAACQNA